MPMILFALVCLLAVSLSIFFLSRRYNDARELVFTVRKDKMLDQVIKEYDNSWKNNTMNRELHYIAVGRIASYFEQERCAEDVAFRYRLLLSIAWILFTLIIVYLLSVTLNISFTKFAGN